jgi:Prophage minor tail protein Z (GPZ)
MEAKRMSRGDELISFDADIFQDTLDACCDDMEGLIKQAIYSTISKLRKRAKTELSAEIREKGKKRWNIQKKDLDKHLSTRIGERGQAYDSFELIIKGRSISLSYFAGTKQYMGNRVQTRTKGQVNKRRSKFQGVEVQVLKGKKKDMGRKLSGAFMQASRNGHVMVMRRKGKGRYPLEIKAVISPASMFSDPETYDRFTDQMMVDLEQLFSHELDYRMTKEGYR